MVFDTFFLILYQMGMDDKTVHRIMDIPPRNHPLDKVQDYAEW